jgi:hypothetical protein
MSNSVKYKWVNNTIAFIENVRINGRNVAVAADVDPNIRRVLSDDDLYRLIIETAIENDQCGAVLGEPHPIIKYNTRFRATGYRNLNDPNTISVFVRHAPFED